MGSRVLSAHWPHPSSGSWVGSQAVFVVHLQETPRRHILTQFGFWSDLCGGHNQRICRLVSPDATAPQWAPPTLRAWILLGLLWRQMPPDAGQPAPSSSQNEPFKKLSGPLHSPHSVLIGANDLYLPSLGDWSIGNTGAQEDQGKQKETASSAFQSEMAVMIPVAILKYLLQSQGFWSVPLTLNAICLTNPKWTSQRNRRMWGPWRKMWVRGSSVLGSLPVAPSSQHSGEDKETSHSPF